MWGCSSRALVRASRTKRSAGPGEGVSPRSSTFTATSCPSVSSRTRNTAANPPSPKTSPTVNFLPRAFWRRRRSVVRSSDMADAKPRNLRRVALGTAGVVFVWLFAVWPPPVWWRDHWPRQTALMREMADCRTAGWPDGRSQFACPTVRPTTLESISPVLQRMVIIAEDSRFRSHVGIDPAEIADALGIDGTHGVWSAVDAASRAYFAVPAARLTAEQAAELAATLPHPRTSNPTFRPDRTLARRNLILARYHGVDVYIPPEEEDTGLVVPQVALPPVDSLTVPLPVLTDTVRDTTSQTDSL